MGIEVKDSESEPVRLKTISPKIKQHLSTSRGALGVSRLHIFEFILQPGNEDAECLSAHKQAHMPRHLQI